MIKQLMIIPFDIGFKPNFQLLKNQDINGFEYKQFNNYEKTILENNIIKFKGINSEIYLNTSGFGVYVTLGLCFDMKFSLGIIFELLINRRNSHFDIIENNSSISQSIKMFCDTVRKKNNIKAKKIRDNIWDGIPYVMSIYFVDEIADEILKDNDKKKAMIALLQPSSIGLEDTRFVEIAKNENTYIEKIKSLCMESYTDILIDYDDKKDVSCFMTWENCVILSKNIDDELEVYKLLETRLQLVWAMSLFTDSWCDKSMEKKIKIHEVEELEWGVLKFFRQVDKLMDASIATRYQKIYNNMVITSSLDVQISQAKESMGYLKKYLDYIRSKRAKRTNLIIESTLFFLALIQLIPIFAELPLYKIELNVFVRFIFLVVTLIFLLLIYLKNR